MWMPLSGQEIEISCSIGRLVVIYQLWAVTGDGCKGRSSEQPRWAAETRASKVEKKDLAMGNGIPLLAGGPNPNPNVLTLLQQAPLQKSIHCLLSLPGWLVLWSRLRVPSRVMFPALAPPHPANLKQGWVYVHNGTLEKNVNC